MKKTLALVLALLMALSLAAPAEEDPQAMMNRAVEAYQTGDYETAMELFTQLAWSTGDAVAQFNVAVMCENGQGMEQSYTVAAEYYRMAAKQGHSGAQYSLGVYYLLGRGVTQSYERAAEYFQLAADQGHVKAMFNLALMYQNGDGVEKSAEKAAEYYLRAADKGYASAQYNIAVCYRDGEGVEQDYDKALEYFEKAAEQGDASAQYNLGIMYLNGKGVEQSTERAVEYLEQAAEQDDADALHNLGILYDLGDGVERDYDRAAEYFRRAAEQGHSVARYNLGVYYRDGLGVEQDYDKAEECFRLSLEQGYAKAQDQLDALEALKNAEASLSEDDPLRAEAVAAGMHLPEPGDGERLYLGVAEVPDTQQTKLFLAFLLAPNGQSIRRMDLFAQALEVTVDGTGEIHLINSETTTSEDQWISLRPDVTNLSFDADTGEGVFDLRVESDVATCRMVLAGHCAKPEDTVDGDYRAEAELTLYNLTGEAANDPVDPPTLEQARALDMKLPDLEKGEALYLGAANVSQAEALYVAFVLTADGQSVRGLTTLVKNMDITYSTGNKTVHATSSGQSFDVNGPQPVAENMTFGSTRLSGFAIDGDVASAVLHYSYHASDDNLDYPFDPARVAFAKVE